MARIGWLPTVVASLGRSGAERDLELARRLGYWHTEEDRQLLREHRAQLALVRRSEVFDRATRVGTVGMLAAAWAIPPLWPVAIIASFRVFPRTSRCLLLGLLGVTGATLVGSGVMVHQVLQSAPSNPPATLPADASLAP
ncbi:MAG: hypothetical protein VKL58_02460 [Cyanobacteriota bacterium]|nr:hypothetical protein [Cyanobacteriota bacterium]